MTHPWQTAAEAVVANWAIDVASVCFISESENFVFQVRDVADRPYVLRLHRPGYHNRAELDAEHVWIRTLANAGLKVPHPHRTTTGDGYATAEAQGETRFAGLYDWEEGQILRNVLADDDSRLDHWYHEIGVTAARMHLVAGQFTPDPDFTRHTFDANGTMGEQPFWGRFWDHPRIPSAASTFLDETRQRLFALLTALPTGPETYGMIHADMHANNVLISSNHELMIIDFDDAGFGWHQFDLAVALPAVDDRHHAAAREALVSGYRSIRDVEDSFFSTIDLFELVRSLNHIGWTLARYDMTDKHLAAVIDHIRQRVGVVLD